MAMIQQQVITNQPSVVTTGVVTTAFEPGREMWSSSLFSCCDDMEICCLGFWCPFILPYKVSADHGEGVCLPILECWSGVVPAVSLGLRVSVRERYRIKGSICDDCCIVTFCGLCSYCQLARELKERRCRHTQVISSTTVQVTSNPPAYYPVQGYGPPQ
ncbi:cornifelin homolog [Gadus macrocephalus]|uniref:cornifelin homolog n=1 Tax=Gadus macrocephalus TaxID=80720 RepID=UPI0028CB7D4F|nr:cornifelin homolog [Gadus macrocephalus]